MDKVPKYANCVHERRHQFEGKSVVSHCSPRTRECLPSTPMNLYVNYIRFFFSNACLGSAHNLVNTLGVRKLNFSMFGVVKNLERVR